jgi:hypothetical protein
VRGPSIFTSVEGPNGERLLRLGHPIFARYCNAAGAAVRPSEKLRVEYDAQAPHYRLERPDDPPALLAKAVSVVRPEDFSVVHYVPVLPVPACSSTPR